MPLRWPGRIRPWQPHRALLGDLEEIALAAGNYSNCEIGLLATCWGALGGKREAMTGLEIEDRDVWLGGPLPVDDLAVGAVAAALLAAAELAEARGGAQPEVTLNAEHVALSFHSERHALVNGNRVLAGFAPMSRILRCDQGGWARTHANYEHHASALRAAIGIPAQADDSEQLRLLIEKAASLGSTELEEAVVEAGGCAAALRSVAQWRSHPAGASLEGTPLITYDQQPASTEPLALAPAHGRPCSGVRVLDLTRVIAGPVAGRTLAALGADVLRIDSPGLPELPAQHIDTGPGKRSAVLDLADANRREALLSDAHVVLIGYRPGALDRFGMTRKALAERHPHLVQVWLSAWGEAGPWRGRRGFDSLVQLASGIAEICGQDGTPGVLPAQALDHASGHLMAAAAMRGLARRVRCESCSPCALSLARTAAKLIDAPRPREPGTEATGAANPDRYRVALGQVSLIAPPGRLAGVPLSWSHGPRSLGGDPPAWW